MARAFESEPWLVLPQDPRFKLTAACFTSTTEATKPRMDKASDFETMNHQLSRYSKKEADSQKETTCKKNESVLFQNIPNRSQFGKHRLGFAAEYGEEAFQTNFGPAMATKPSATRLLQLTLFQSATDNSND